MLNEACGVVHNARMNDPEPIDPRRRIRELTAIPERDRTDEQWDELNELEIRTAPGNRESDRNQDRQLGKRPGYPMPVRRPDRNQGVNSNGPIVALPNGSIGDPSVRSVRPVTADGRFFRSAKKADAWNYSGSLCLLAHRVHPFHFVQAMTASKKGRLASLR